MGKRRVNRESVRALKPSDKVLTSEELNKYEPNIDLRETTDDFWKVKTVPEMMELLEKRADIDIDARVMGMNKGQPIFGVKMDKKSFLEAAGSTATPNINLREMQYAAPTLKFKENFNDSDNASAGFGYGISNAGLVGSDFVPLLGGPFNHQQYIHDYLQATSQSFFAYHHDPIARLIVNLICDFSLGRSFRLDAVADDHVTEQIAQALWDATDKVNDFENMMNQVAKEISIYGEEMVWELPDSWSKIEYKIKTGQDSPAAFLPRFRLIDPTVIWDIITYPEDITRVLAYQWVAPTQYQIYTKDNKTGTTVPSLKFIYQQIPASQVDHWKINCVSDEKRGRGDMYPVLGYLKRLRDSVNYKVISEQKNSAWSIDTSIDGSQEDIQAYYQSQQQIGTFPPAGSEFIHSMKVKREYLGNNKTGGGGTETWEWCANMIAAGTGIPISYWGVSSGHGMSRASSMVATEPVVKKFEMRRRVFERILKRVFERTMNRFGIKAECEITFPEIVVQDRSAKLADLQLAQTNEWFSRERAATLASKEFDINKYDFDTEQDDIKNEQSLPQPMGSPLTTPGEMDSKAEVPGGPEPEAPQQPVKAASHPEGFDSKSKRSLRLGRGH